MGSNRKSLVEKVEKTKLGAEDEVTLPAPILSQQIEKSRVRNKSYVLDLRIHSPVSLGYFGIEGVDAAPALVRVAKVKGLDIIAVTDFFSGKFIDRVAKAAEDTEITVLPGVTLRCHVGDCGDVTICCLFREGTPGSEVERFLLELGVPQSKFGNKAYLLTIPLERILQAVEKFGALAIPSRMDKTPQRMLVIPELVERYGFRAFDVAYADSIRWFKKRWPKIKFTIFSFSNANSLAQVGSRRARVKMSEPGFAGIKELVRRS